MFERLNYLWSTYKFFGLIDKVSEAYKYKDYEFAKNALEKAKIYGYRAFELSKCLDCISAHNTVLLREGLSDMAGLCVLLEVKETLKRREQDKTRTSEDKRFLEELAK